MENSILVGDAERRQLDLVHAVKDSLYKLWAEGMNKQEREAVSVR